MVVEPSGTSVLTPYSIISIYYFVMFKWIILENMCHATSNNFNHDKTIVPFSLFTFNKQLLIPLPTNVMMESLAYHMEQKSFIQLII